LKVKAQLIVRKSFNFSRCFEFFPGMADSILKYQSRKIAEAWTMTSEEMSALGVFEKEIVRKICRLAKKKAGE
jgi:hypothetical protein